MLKDNAQGCSSSHLDAVLQALNLSSPPAPDHIQLSLKLQKLKNTQSKALAAAEVKNLLVGLPTDAAADIPPLDKLEPSAVLKTMRTCGDIALDEGGNVHLWQTVYWLFRRGQALLLEDGPPHKKFSLFE